MKVLLRLFSTKEKAADGSIIPRDVVEKYLNSEDYKTIIRDKIALGGVTHKDRGSQQLEQYEAIGEDDPILITDNVTHYITKIFFKDANDPICYGEIELFNADDFSGKRRDMIKNLEGLLKSGTLLPISIVIQAVWSSQEVCENIVRIKGLDFTMNPSFPSAGVIKVYSDHSKFEVKTIKSKKYSKERFEKIKIFSRSTSPEIPLEPSDENLTDREYRLKYGRKDKTSNSIKELAEETIIEESSLEPDKYLGNLSELSTKNYSYSIPAIEARLKMIEMDPKNLLNRLVNNYTRYYRLHKNNLNDKQMKFLKLILIQDINYILRLQFKFLEQGTNLSARLGLARYENKPLQRTAYILGMRYRRAIIADKKLGFIPKNIYNLWVNALEAFYNGFCDMIFNSEFNFYDEFTHEKSFSGYTEIGVGLDQQNDYKSIKDQKGNIIGGNQFITIIDPAFGIDSKLQNYFCHE